MSRMRRERGALALAALMLGLLVVAGLALNRLEQATRFRNGVDEVATTRALAQAKAALLDFAVLRAGGVYPAAQVPLGGAPRPVDLAQRPGALPCPDVDGDGTDQTIADTNGARCASYIGWLPEGRLQRGELRDGSGAKLWYGLSEMLSLNPTAANAPNALNPSVLQNFNGPDLAMTVTVDSVVVNDVVAIVIAPGPALSSETRALAGALPNAVNQIANWLDSLNADITGAGAEPSTGPRTYFGTTPESETPTANDRIITITRAEVMGRVQALAVAEFGAALRRRYYNPAPNAVLESGNCLSYDAPAAVLSSVSEWCLPWPSGTLPPDWPPGRLPPPAALPIPDAVQVVALPGQLAGWLGHGGSVRTVSAAGVVSLLAATNQFTTGAGATLNYQITGAIVQTPPPENPALSIANSVVTGTAGPVTGTVWCALTGPEIINCLYESVGTVIDLTSCAAGEELQTRRQLYMPFLLPAADGTWTVRTATGTTERRRHFNITTANVPGGGWPTSAVAEAAMPSLFADAGVHMQASTDLSPLGGVRVVRQCVAASPPGTPDVLETPGTRVWKFLRFSDSGTLPPGDFLNLADTPYPFQIAELEPLGIANGGEISGLPYWFRDNGWHRHVGTVLSSALYPSRSANWRCVLIPPSTNSCTATGGQDNQITLDGPHPARAPGASFAQTGVTLAVVGAGVTVDGQTRSPTASPAAYFEQPGAFVDGAPGSVSYPANLQLVAFGVPVTEGPAANTRNDQLLIVDKQSWTAGAVRASPPAPVASPLSVLLP